MSSSSTSSSQESAGRNLFKKTPEFKRRFRLDLLRVISTPISLSLANHSDAEDTEVSVCIDKVAKWVLAMEIVSHMGSLGNREALEALKGLERMVAVGKRSRLRNTKIAKTEKKASSQAERGLERVKKAMEEYLVDDLCWLFEGSKAKGELYTDLDEVKDDFRMGLRLVKQVASTAATCIYTPNLPGVVLLGFAFYLTEVLVSGLKRVSNKLYSLSDPFVVRSEVENFSRIGLENFVDTVGCLGESEGERQVSSGLVLTDLFLARIGASCSVIEELVRLLAKMQRQPDNSLDSTSGQNTVFVILMEKMKEADGSKESLKRLGKVVRSVLDGMEEAVFVGGDEFAALLAEVILYVSTCDNGMAPSGILRRSKFGLSKLLAEDARAFQEHQQSSSLAISQIANDKSALDSQMKAVLKTAHSENLEFDDWENATEFVRKSFTMAKELQKEYAEMCAERQVDGFAEFKRIIHREFVMGLLGCDLKGFVAVLYEDYIAKELLACFDESTGLRSTKGCRAAGRRERSTRKDDGRRKRKQISRAPDEIGGKFDVREHSEGGGKRRKLGTASEKGQRQ